MQKKDTISSNRILIPDIENDITHAAYCVLDYFNLFSHPLTLEEILHYCPVACSRPDIHQALTILAESNKIYFYKNYYSLNKEIKKNIIKREKGNELAKIKIKGAKKTGSFIFGFPFVKFVGISGSLSKGYAEDKSDYDFFIITSKNRLWICRTLLHLFKKITFLAGQQNKFCMNYFVDENALLIEEKNRFTATELITLIPVKGHNTYTELVNVNKWVQDYFPNKGGSSENNKETDRNAPLKKIAEYVFNILMPNSLNRALMKLTDAKWRKKWTRKNFPMKEYDIAFKTTLHVSKNHPLNHQKKVLEHIKKNEQ